MMRRLLHASARRNPTFSHCAIRQSVLARFLATLPPHSPLSIATRTLRPIPLPHTERAPPHRALSTHILPDLPSERIQYRRRNSKLRHLLEGSPHDRAEAERLFASLLHSRLAREGQLGVMLKASVSSDAARLRMRQAASAGVTLAESHYSLLLARLLIEARGEGEVRAAVEEMEAAGVRPAEQTARTLELARDAGAMARRRATVLRSLVELGEAEREGAWALFERLLEARVANEHHLTIMLKNCGRSDTMHELIARAEAAGVSCRTPTHTLLFEQFRLEADEAAAAAHLAQCAAPHDARLQYVAALREPALSARRGGKLSYFLSGGSRDQEEAMTLFTLLAHRQKLTPAIVHIVRRLAPPAAAAAAADIAAAAGVPVDETDVRLSAHAKANRRRQVVRHVEHALADGSATPPQVTLAVRLCASSEQAYELLARAHGLGLVLGPAAYTVLFKQLHIEGASEVELLAAKREMRARGTHEDATLRHAMQPAAHEVRRMQSAELLSLFSQPEGAADGLALFERMLRRGVADGAHLSLVLRKGCANEEERQAMAAKALAFGVQVQEDEPDEDALMEDTWGANVWVNNPQKKARAKARKARKARGETAAPLPVPEAEAAS